MRIFGDIGLLLGRVGVPYEKEEGKLRYKCERKIKIKNIKMEN